MELNTASPKNSSRSLFSSAPSLTLRWLNAVLYNAISPGVKPKYITQLFFKLPVMSLAFKKIFYELQNG